MSYDCVCDYDAPTFVTRRVVKAAKNPHTCEECRRIIAVDEPYEYTAGMWLGYFSTFKTCADCLELRRWAIASVPCFCWAHGSLHEDVREMVEEVAREMPGFFFEYGRRMIAIRRKRLESKA